MEFLWRAHMLNEQYVHKGWTEGRNLLVCRAEMVHICWRNEHTELETTGNISRSLRESRNL
jgi:hypothetical protein